MTDYTPTTEEVREAYSWALPNSEYGKGLFERWLAAHDAEVRQDQADYDAVRINDLDTRLATAERLLAEQGEPEWEWLGEDKVTRRLTDKPGIVQEWLKRGFEVWRRTKAVPAGPWEPVEENTPHTEGNDGA